MRENVYDAETITVEGLEFEVVYAYDTDAGAPWENSDGHGPVRRAVDKHYRCCSDKKPGERPMNRAGRNEYQYYYDWQAACKRAREEGWDAPPYGQPNRVQRAVQADFDFLCDWVNDQWCYVCVAVRPAGDEDADWDYLGWVETFKDYHHEAAREMARERAHVMRKEAVEARYWAERDVVTTN